MSVFIEHPLAMQGLLMIGWVVGALVKGKLKEREILRRSERKTETPVVALKFG